MYMNKKEKQMATLMTAFRQKLNSIALYMAAQSRFSFWSIKKMGDVNKKDR